MKKILLAFLLATTAISCTNSSSSDAPPAGKDGEKLVGEEKLSIGGANAGSVAIAEPGKDLVLAVAFPLDHKQSGQLRITEQQTDIEKAVEKAPKPLDPRVEEYLKKVCFLQDTPHYWVIRRQNNDTRYTAGQVMNFDFGSDLYLVIETRGKPKCEEMFFSFKTELLGSSAKPEPTPEPTPTPAPIEPPGSEKLLLVDPLNPGNFNITYDRGQGRDFTYKVSMLLNGIAFGKGNAVEKIFVSVYDKTAKTFVSDWTLISEQNPAAVLPDQFRLQFTLDKFSAPFYIIERQKEMVLTFAVNSPDNSVLPIRSLDLGNICANLILRNSVVNNKTGTSGCP